MAINTKIPGFFTEMRLRLIEFLAKQIPPGGTIIEIGSYVGQTAWVWAKNAPQARVVCIDPWDPAEFHPAPGPDGAYQVRSECTIENFQHWTKDCPNIETIMAKSPQLEWTGPVDAVFIDDSADDALPHIEFWWPHIRKLGFICGHLQPNPIALQTAVPWAVARERTLEVRRWIWRIKK